MNRIFKTLALAAAITAMAVPAFAAESAPLHQTVTSPQVLTLQSAGSEHFTGEVVTAALYGPAGTFQKLCRHCYLQPRRSHLLAYPRNGPDLNCYRRHRLDAGMGQKACNA